MKRNGILKAVAALLGMFVLSFFAPMASADEGSGIPGADKPYCQYEPFICASNLWPDEFAAHWGIGAFPGDGPGSEQHFAFTDGAEEKVANLRQLFPDNQSTFIAHTYEFSQKYLFALQARVDADFKKLRSGELLAPHDSFEFGMIGLMGERNRLVIPMLPFPPAFEAWALERWGKAVELQSDPYLMPWPGTEMPGRTYPYVPPADEPDTGSPDGSGSKGEASLARLKADRTLVRKCRKAGRSSSRAKRRFAKSRKCNGAKARVRAATR